MYYCTTCSPSGFILYAYTMRSLFVFNLYDYSLFLPPALTPYTYSLFLHSVYLSSEPLCLLESKVELLQ